MGNDSFLNLISETMRKNKERRGVQKTPLPMIGDRDTFHLLRSIMMCDRYDHHPINDFIYSYIQDDMREVYIISESIIQRIYHYIEDCPIDELTDHDDIVRDLMILENKIGKLDRIFMIKYDHVSWYVGNRDIDFIIEHSRINNDLDKIAKDLDQRITYLNLIFINIAAEAENLKYSLISRMSSSVYQTCLYYTSYIEGYSKVFNGLRLLIVSIRKSVEFLHGILTGVIENE